MIILKNINIKDNYINCDIYPEDSVRKGTINICLTDEEIIDYSLPLGYEWCKNHIYHAINFLIENKKDLPDEKLIMWF